MEWRKVSDEPAEFTLALVAFHDNTPNSFGSFMVGTFEPEEGWYFADLKGDPVSMGGFTPTHWMPLPAPPTPNGDA